MKDNMVPAWRAGCLDGDAYNSYVCLDCGLKMINNRIGKGVWITNDEIFTCPICSSKEKTPTKKATEEELEEKKSEIRERMK